MPTVKEHMEPDYKLTKPRTELYVGDCRVVAPELGRKFDVVFGDPPFHIGQKYLEHNDKKMTHEEYMHFSECWLGAATDRLTSRGSLWVNCHDPVAADIEVYCRDVLGLHMRRHIIWAYTFGQCITSNFISSHQHLLYFVRNKKDFIWTYEDMLVDSARKSKYKDKRIETAPLKGQRVPQDVWFGDGFCRVQGNNSERRKEFPNQLPEAYMHRLLSCCTDEHSEVLEMFCGSGTTPIVARAMNLPCVAIEIGPDTAKEAWKYIVAGSKQAEKWTVD